MWFNYVTYDLMLNPTKRSVYCEDGNFTDGGEPRSRTAVIGDLFIAADCDGEHSAVTVEADGGEVVHSAILNHSDLRRAFLEALNGAHRLLDPRFVVAVEMDLPKRDHEQLTLI